MPFYTDDSPILPRQPQQAVIPDKPDPGLLDTIGAAFRMDNPVTNVVRALNRPTFEREPDHNPLDVIRGTPFEANHLDKFVGSQSAAETRAIMARIDEEEADRRILDAAGVPGFIAQVGAGVLDPTIVLPGGAIYRGIRTGQAAARSAVSVGAAAAAQAGAQEAVLQGLQETRTGIESALNVGSATILGGLIGAGASALLTPAERRILEEALDRTRAEVDAHAAGLPAPTGAAPTDTRSLTMVGHGLGMTDRLSPLRRVLSIEDDVIKRDIADLVESPYRFEENLVGQATSQAPSVERLARQAINGTRATVGDDLNRLFADYRFGQPDITLPGVRAQYERFRGQDGGKMTRGEFNRAVSEALMFGDKSDIPQVQQAAQLIRSRVFEPWAARAEKALEGFKRGDQAEGEAYFPHYWNKELIRARRPEFVNKITEHYVADQTKKAAAKERLQWFDAQLRSWETQIDKLESRFKRAEDRAKQLEAQAKERARDDRPQTVGMNEAAPEGRTADLQRRVAIKEMEAQELEDAIELARELVKQYPTLSPVLQRRVDELDRKYARIDIERARHQEAGRAAKRGEKRLAHLEERLKDTNDRKELIDDMLVVANGIRDDVRAKIEAEISAWEGKSAQEAKQALKGREDYAKEALRMLARTADSPRLTGADSAIDKAVKRIIESDRDLSVQELRARANETVDRILGSPDGRLPYDMASGGPRMGVRAADELRGSAAAREFAISNRWAQEWLEDDIEQVMALYLRTMVPDTLIAERFGDVNMEQVFRRIDERYAQRIDETGPSEKKRKELDAERDMVTERVAAFRDRIRGTFGWSPEAGMQNMARYANAAKNVNNLTSMGVAAVSSLPDMAGVVFRYGFSSAFRDGWAPFFRGLTTKDPEWQKFKGQMRALGIGVETAINARQHALDDVMDVYRPQSRWERGLQYGSDKFFIANLLAPETDMFKTIASHVAVSEILRATAAVKAGKAAKWQIANLAESSIDAKMAQRIADQFEQHGGISEKGVRLPNLADWTDRAAADALAGAIGREVDIAVVTPGQEKPLWLSRPVVSILGQFKSFTASATERVLIANLQRRDANTLQGLIAAVGLGMLSYKLNSFFGGQDTSERPQDWFKEGVSRAGLLGWFEEGNALASKATRGTIDIHRLYGADKPASRYVSRNIPDMLLGPTVGKLKDMGQVTGSAISRDWSESDTKALRRMMASQNLFYLRGLFNQVEEAANAKLGIQ